MEKERPIIERKILEKTRHGTISAIHTAAAPLCEYFRSIKFVPIGERQELLKSITNCFFEADQSGNVNLFNELSCMVKLPETLENRIIEEKLDSMIGG
jgi:hypothetical protein